MPKRRKTAAECQWSRRLNPKCLGLQLLGLQLLGLGLLGLGLLGLGLLGLGLLGLRLPGPRLRLRKDLESGQGLGSELGENGSSDWGSVRRSNGRTNPTV